MSVTFVARILLYTLNLGQDTCVSMLKSVLCLRVITDVIFNLASVHWGFQIKLFNYQGRSVVTHLILLGIQFNDCQ